MLSVLPRERRTFLFSATMTSKVAKLQRACLKNPARVRQRTTAGSEAALNRVCFCNVSEESFRQRAWI